MILGLKEFGGPDRHERNMSFSEGFIETVLSASILLVHNVERAKRKELTVKIFQKIERQHNTSLYWLRHTYENAVSLIILLRLYLNMSHSTFNVK